MSAATPDRVAALALYKRACTTHKRTDWRLACHALAKVAQAAEQAPQPVAMPTPDREPQPLPSRPRGLLQFLAGSGGIRDPGGELSAMDAEHWHKGRPFMKRLVRDDGRTLEHAAEAAWEAGFFPDACPDYDDPAASQPVSEAELLEAIRQEIAAEYRS